MTLCSPFSENTWSIALLCISLAVGLLGTLAIRGYPVGLYVSLPVAAGLYATIGTTAIAGLQVTDSDIVNSAPRALAWGAWFSAACSVFDVGLAVTSFPDRAIRGIATVLLAVGGLLYCNTPSSRHMQAASFVALFVCFIMIGFSWRLGRSAQRPAAGAGRFVPEVPLAIGAVFSLITASVMIAWEAECPAEPVEVQVGLTVVVLVGSISMLQAQAALVLLGGVVSGRDPVLHVPNAMGLFFLRFRSPAPSPSDDQIPIADVETDTSPGVSAPVAVATSQTLWELGDLGTASTST